MSDLRALLYEPLDDTTGYAGELPTPKPCLATRLSRRTPLRLEWNGTWFLATFGGCDPVAITDEQAEAQFIGWAVKVLSEEDDSFVAFRRGDDIPAHLASALHRLEDERAAAAAIRAEKDKQDAE